MKNLVIDTNVLLSDPTCIFKFDEHRIYIPTYVLYELDNIKDRRDKAGVTKEAREAIKIISDIVEKKSSKEIQTGVPIIYPANFDNNGGTLAVIGSKKNEIEDIVKKTDLDDSPDSKIIACCLLLQEQKNDNVVLVTQDVNMRLIASSVGVQHVEGYKNEKALDDVDLLSSGVFQLEAKSWNDLVYASELDEELGSIMVMDSEQFNGANIGTFVLLSDEHLTIVGSIIKVEDDKVFIQSRNADEMAKRKAWGIIPRNKEQQLALDCLLDQNVDLVTLHGGAGTGKTLLALASAIEQVLEQKRYDKIILTRAIAHLDEEIGHLPGTEEEKMSSWLGGFVDAMEALHKNDEKSHTGVSSERYVMEKANIQFKSLNFMRGRSLQDAICIIDESQNLTRHQIKSIVTRAGKNCKLVFLGNLAQIDKHYLTALSSGLTHLVVETARYEGARSLHLNEIERSRLAEFGESHL